MKKKAFDGFIYVMGSFDEMKQFCDIENLTMLKAPQERLTEKGETLFENYEYYTTIKA